MTCSICQEASGKYHLFREMMFGLRNEFEYFECGQCGCLQIGKVPENLGDYYPEDYYSMTVDLKTTEVLLYKLWFKVPQIGRVVRRFRPFFADPRFQAVLEAKPKAGARILDVGCGAGMLIEVLQKMGYDAQGVDPFVKEATARIHKTTLENMPGGWDLLMFHHSLEHMMDNVPVLSTARQKLAPGGTCLVRIPVANWSWQTYGRDWVQLDAPRHLTIHTPASFARAAEKAGLRIVKTIYDSSAFQIFGSEMYRRDIPLLPGGEPVPREKMREFDAKAKELNERGLGDQAAFYMEAI